MNKTPLSMRKNVAIFGNTNSGKSTLFNSLLGQEVSIVSSVSGTTTDPVIKAMELVGYGPVTLIDTAGLADDTTLGEKRVKKTRDILRRTDLVLFVTDITDKRTQKYNFGNVSVVRIFTKCDLADKKLIETRQMQFPDAVFVKEYSKEEIIKIQDIIVSQLKKQEDDMGSMLEGLVASGDTVVMVIPIDGEAPKGRLILPQVQAIRNCLDNNVNAFCVTPDMLNKTLEMIPKPDLVVTDSQIFAEVDKIVPQDILLTSFSMLLANQKGDIMQLIDGTDAIDKLDDNDEILMLEACTHSTSHEDIGKVKIPALLKKKTGKDLKFTHLSGYDLPEDIKKYKMIIHCGGCMMNKREIQNRLEFFESEGVPVTNYGVVLAYLSGISQRANKVFIKN